jgi:ABC-type transport system involved in multi-copper enzyme maturation permease subunit
MSSNAITEKKETPPTRPRWHVARETAPSVIEADRPLLPRVVGAVGLLLVTVGGVPLAARLGASRVFLRQLSEILPAWLAALLAVGGLGCLLYHAANDADFQIRRAYMWKGLAWLSLGVLLSFLPASGGDGAAAANTRFLPFGLFGLVLGLLFLLAFQRNESDARVRELVSYAVGGLGAAMAAAGFLVGTLNSEFLLPIGLLLILLGLPFLGAFIGMRGSADSLGHKASLAMGGLGAVAFLIAFVRSFILPLLVSWGWLNPTPSYTIPYGLLLMGGGLIYAAVSIGIVSDHPLVVLTRRELASIFFSPIAYTLLVGFQLIGFGLFFDWVFSTLWTPDPGRGQVFVNEVSEPIVMSYFWNFFPVVCAMFVVPILTMRMISEEKRTGTLEMLLTAPINETVVVVSKFIAAFVFFMVLWIPLGLYLVSLRAESGRSFDYLPVLAYYIALAASGAGFVSMGIFCSSLTSNQIAAALLTFVGMVWLTLQFWVHRIVPFGPTMKAVVIHMSYVDLWRVAVEGKLTSWDLLFHVSMAFFWLFLAVKVLESRKWR